MRIAAIQHDIAWEDPEGTFARVEPWIARAAAADARLVVLTEMYSTGFSMRTEVTAEPPEGPSTAFLAKQAEGHGVWLAASIPERPDGADKPFNTLVVAGPQGQRERYRKIHPFTYSEEPDHFDAGEEFCTTEIDGLRFTWFVCFDLRFADEFWATAGDTDCYVVPANWPASRRRHWTTLLEARAIENQAYVVGANRVGEAGSGLAYVGDSRIVDPLGTVLASAEQAETMLLADVDAETVAAARQRYGFLDARRHSPPPAPREQQPGG